MKKIAILFLIVIVFIQCSMKTAIVAYYEINKDYIAANWCDNKAKPQMQCNGKCYLAKKIKAQENQESKLPSLLKEIKQITLFCSSFNFSFTPASYFIRYVQNAQYVLKHYTSPLSSIFQPPQ